MEISSGSEQSAAPMGAARRLVAVFGTVVIIVLFLVVTHAGVEYTYTQLEDVCVGGLCLDRQPQAP